MQKFSNDSAGVVCICDGQEEEYRALVNNLVEWSRRNHLLLTIAKATDTFIGFRRKRMATQNLCIVEEDVGMVEDYKYYKYLGVHIDNRLSGKSNI